MRHPITAESFPPILFTPDEVRNTDTGRLHYAQTPSYFDAIEAVGGDPTMSGVSTDYAIVESRYLKAAAVVVTGGLDVNPELYSDAPLPVEVEQHLNTGSLANDVMGEYLIKRAVMDGKPLLLICRGVQLGNVALGGSLYPHLPLEFNGEIDHLNQEKNVSHRHEIIVEPNSKLSALMFGEEKREVNTAEVNSYHHQAVQELGEGLQIVAHSPDGVVEALEMPGHPWLIGPQWHVESMQDEASHRILSSFVQAAREYALKVATEPSQTSQEAIAELIADAEKYKSKIVELPIPEIAEDRLAA